MCALNARRLLRRLRLPLLVLGPPLIALVVYATAIEPRIIEITHHRITVKDLPPEFEGFRVVQLTDIHAGLWVSNDSVRKWVALANAQKPNVVMLTGDYLTRLSKDIPGTGRALGGLRAKHGIYAVLGNHDYWENPDGITKALHGNGIEVLVDESKEIRVGRSRLLIVGTDDLWAGSPDYENAFRAVDESDACIVLAHNPGAVRHVDARLTDLMLAGHTHGGLVVLPRLGALLGNSNLGRRMVSGFHDIGGVRIYISRGLAPGTTLIPIRFRCRPEIAVFTLHRAGKDT